MKWPGGFTRSLLAILGGNLVYFLLLPLLPPAIRHQAFRNDVGLVIDFCICAGIYGLLCWIWPVNR